MARTLKARWLRLLVSAVSTAALSAVVVPAAQADITPPPSPIQVGSFITISNLTMNGQATTMVAVAPGAAVTISATVTEDRHGYCPGCIAFVPVKLATASTPAGCLLNGTIGNNNVRHGTVGLTAPTSPGVYDVQAGYALQYSCNWQVGGVTTIARIVVKATTDQLCALVRSYSSKPVVGAVLCLELKIAQRAMDRGHPIVAALILRAFRTQVSALTGTAFTPDQADVLKLLASYLGAGSAGSSASAAHGPLSALADLRRRLAALV